MCAWKAPGRAHPSRSTLGPQRLAAFAAGVDLPLLRLQRAYPPLRSRKCMPVGAAGAALRSSSGLARFLSPGAARQGLVPYNPVQDARAQGAQAAARTGVDDAVRLAEHDERAPTLLRRATPPWSVFYGCGLRVGELVGLDLAPARQRTVRGAAGSIWQAREAHVFGKGSQACLWARLRPRRWSITSSAPSLRRRCGGRRAVPGRKWARLTAQSCCLRQRSQPGRG